MIAVVSSISAWGQTFSVIKPSINYPNFENYLFSFDENLEPINLSSTLLTLKVNDNNIPIDSILIQTFEVKDSLELLVCFELTSALSNEDKIFIKNYLTELKKINNSKFINKTVIFFNEYQLLVLDLFSTDISKIDMLLDADYYVKPDWNKLIKSNLLFNYLNSNLDKSLIVFSKSSPKLDIPSFSQFLSDNSIDFLNINLKTQKNERYKDLANQTKSLYINKSDFSSDLNLFNTSIFIACGGKPSKIFWNKFLDTGNIQLILSHNQEIDSVSFRLFQSEIPILELQGHTLFFGNIDSGYTQTKSIRLFAKNKNVEITNIVIENPDFKYLDFTPNFTIKKDTYIDLRILYESHSSDFIHSKLHLYTNSNKIYDIILSAGQKPPLSETSIDIIQPLEEMKIIENEPYSIFWDHTYPLDTFKIDYKPSSDTVWSNLTLNAIHNEYVWQIPSLSTNKIDIKVSQTASNLVSEKVIQLIGHTKKITDLIWSPNDSLIATSSEDGRIFLWNPKTGKMLKTLFQSQSKIISSIDWSNDGKFIAIAASDTLIKIWNINSDVLERELKAPQKILKIRYSKNDEKIIGVLETDDIMIWDMISGNIELNIKSGSFTIDHLIINPSFPYFATGSKEGKVIIWNYQNGNKIKEFDLSPYPIFGLAFSPKGNNIAISSSESKVKIFDMNGTNVLTLFDTDSPIFDVNWITNNQFIASSLKKNVRLWAPTDGSLINSYDQHNSNVYSITSNHNGSLISSIEENNIVHIWSPFDFPFFRPELISSTVKNIEVLHKEISSPELILPPVQKGDSIYYFDNDFASNESSFDIIIDTCYLQSNIQKMSLINPQSSDNFASSERITGEIEFFPEDSMMLVTSALLKSGSKFKTKKITAFVPTRFFDKKVKEIDFGIIKLGSTKDTTLFILQNISSSQFLIDSISILSNTLTAFTVQRPSFPYIMQPQGGALVPNIVFAPQKIGYSTSILRIYFKNSIPFDILLKGYGIAPKIQTDSIVSLGKFLCESFFIHQIPLKNIGNAVLQISDIQVIGDDFNEISKINLGSNQLSINDETIIEIYISPKRVGDKNFYLQINTNIQSDIKSSTTIHVVLTKDSVKLNPESSEISFFPKDDTDKIQKKVKIDNSGNIATKISIIKNPNYFSIDSIVANGKDAEIFISFIGGMNSEEYSDTLLIADNCLRESSLILLAYPNKKTALIEALPTQISFDEIICENNQTKNTKIKNIGNDTLVITEGKILNSQSIFQIPNINKLKIAPNFSYDLSVTFLPQSDGLYTDSLILNSNAVNYDNGILKIALSGSKNSLKYKFSKDSVFFKLLTPGSNDSLTFTFANIGLKDLKLKFVNNNPMFSYSFPEISKLKAGDEMSISAIFHGSDVPGIFYDNFIFEDSCGNTQNVLLIAEVTNENNFFEVSLPQPNPAQDKTQIIIKSTENFEWNYRLLDNIGKLIIQSENKFENTGYGNLGLNLNNLAIGVYILEINTSKGKYIRKIIKLQ